MANGFYANMVTKCTIGNMVDHKTNINVLNLVHKPQKFIVNSRRHEHQKQSVIFYLLLWLSRCLYL